MDNPEFGENRQRRITRIGAKIATLLRTVRTQLQGVDFYPSEGQLRRDAMTLLNPGANIPNDASSITKHKPTK